MYETTVLIAGAGPTGLTLAIDLVRRGIPCRIIDAAEMPSTGVRGKGIQPRTLEIFEDLGVIDPILAAGGPYPRLRVHFGPISFRLGSLDSAKAPTENTPYPSLWMVAQGQTEAILRERLLALGDKVEFGKALTTFTQDDQSVDVRLSDGESLRVAYLVGCDGGRSTVRRTLGLKLNGETVDEKSLLVADVEIEGLSHEDWHLWPSFKNGPLGLCPMPHSSIFQLTAKAAALDANVEGAVEKLTGRRIRRIAWRSIYQPAVRMVDRYRVGRVLLAGDAAHVHPPTGGQGLNTGVQDAYNLGWKLAHAVRHGADASLDTYESERLPIAAAVLGLSRKLYKTRSIQRGDLTNQLGLHYRSSSLSSGDVLGTLHPGDRMPDVRLADGSRLFEHMRGPHATEFATREGPRILIRPDGYIAEIGLKHFGEYMGEATHEVEGSILRKA